jgi:cell division protein FtsB
MKKALKLLAEIRTEIKKRSQLILIILAVIFLCTFIFLYYMQTQNYNNTLALYEDEFEKNQLLNAQLDAEAATVKRLSAQLDAEAATIKLLNEQTQSLVITVTKQIAEIAEWREKYFMASYEAGHVNWVMRLNVFGEPLYVPFEMDNDLVNLIKKHFNAWYSGDEETYKSTVILREPDDIMQHYVSLVAENDYYRAEVKFIAVLISYPTSVYSHITVLVQEDEDSESSLVVWPAYISLFDEGWRIWDFH